MGPELGAAVMSAGTVLTPRLASTLDVLAAEIELAGARCIYLDEIVGELVDRLAAADRERIVERLQQVDLLSQHLTGLSAFTRSLSLSVPDAVTAPVASALSEITLGALAERIVAGLGGDDGGEPADSGDLDLF